MRLPEEQDERGMGMPVIYTIMAVSAFILIILAVVLLNNRSSNTMATNNQALLQSPSPTPAEQVEFAQGQEDIETLYRENKLRAEDLDFWNMYQDDEIQTAPAPSTSPTPSPTHEPTEEELAGDGKHTQVTYRNGEREWIEISEDIPLYSYDFTNLRSTNGKMVYYVDGKESSRLGVELSHDSGDVDFKALKADGVDFVMLRLGVRGYESGLVSLDESFVSNITAAANAGLDIGISFFSQAVNVEEAVAEAEFVVSNLVPYTITYPVVFDMEYIANDSSRIDTLDADQKTQIAEAFLSYVKGEGYHAMLYGNKNWLLTELIPDKLLVDYDVWLSDPSPVPDYPYQFQMWEYAVDQTITGVEGKANYTVSFIDYTRR